MPTAPAGSPRRLVGKPLIRTLIGSEGIWIMLKFNLQDVFGGIGGSYALRG